MSAPTGRGGEDAVGKRWEKRRDRETRNRRPGPEASRLHPLLDFPDDFSVHRPVAS
jgi:hypothetical protein